MWLNEAQRYLGTADGAGERVAAGLRALLRDRDRGPVLVLATLWPEFWDELTARPPGGADPHAQARELLAGHDIPVPAAFTDEAAARAGGGGGSAADPGGRREPGRAGDPVPGRGAGTAGPLPQRTPRRPGADPRRDGRLPAGHAPRLAPGLPGDGRARVPDRHRLGPAARRLAGAGAGLHRQALQGSPRAAGTNPAPPRPRRPGQPRRRAGLAAGRLSRPARPPGSPRADPAGILLGRRSQLR